MTSPILVRVHSDVPTVERGLVSMLQEHPRIRAESAGTASAQETPEVQEVLVDLIHLPPDISQLSTAALVDEESPVVLLLDDPPETWPDDFDVPIAALPSDADGEAICAAVVAVAEGLSVIDSDLARSSRIRWVSDAGNDAREPNILTPREYEVLQLVSEGLPNKTIALLLGISEHTVKFHMGSLMGKLGAASRTEAVMIATRRGILTI